MAFVPPDPRDRLGLVILWNVMNIFSVFANATVFVSYLCIPRLRRNVILLNLLLTFIIASSLATSLTWTGNMLKQQVPYGVCLFNGSFMYTNGYFGGGSALALTLKVWSNTMSVLYPTNRVLRWLSYEPFLVAIPYLVTAPLWAVALATGVEHPETVFRVTHFHCIVYHPVLALMNPWIGAILSSAAFILCVWTGVIVSRIRRNVRSSSDNPIKNYSLVLRTLVFGVFVLIGAISNIVAIPGHYDKEIRSIFLSTGAVGSWIIFGSDKDVLALLFRCDRNTATDTTSQYRSTAISYTKQTVIRREGPNGELVTFPANGSGAPPFASPRTKRDVDMELGPVSTYDVNLDKNSEIDVEDTPRWEESKQVTIVRTPSADTKEDLYRER